MTAKAYNVDVSGVYSWVEFREVATFVVLEVLHTS